MNPLYAAGLELQDFCREQGWKCCLIGGLAVARWGRPRATQDVDLSLLTGFGNEEPYIDLLLARYRGRRPDARQFALDVRVLLVEAPNGVYVDLALAGLPFEQRMMDRATPFSYTPKVSLITASAEDLIVTKGFADRRQDWVDIEGILVRQRGRLDWDYTLRELTALCELKEAPQIVEELTQMRAKIDAE